MRPGPVRGGWLALLFGAVLASTCPRPLCAAPDEPPEGFVWEDLKEIHGRLLRPQKWLFRRVPLNGSAYNVSPEPFDRPVGVRKGLVVWVIPGANADGEKSADEMAVAAVAQYAARYKVIRGWTRRNTPSEPFTTYTLVYAYRREADGGAYTGEMCMVVNRATNTVYSCWLFAPSAEWKEIEQAGEMMLANLRLDAKF